MTVTRMPAPERRPVVVRLNDLSTIVVAVDYMVGFRPANSLVAVALTGERERMTVCLRLDLPPVDDSDDVIRALSNEVAMRMAHAEADAVLLFVYVDEPPEGWVLPHRRLVEACEDVLDALVREAALVSGDRMWSYVCDDTRCCPPEGRPIDRQSPAALALAAEHAALGNVVLGSRDELVASTRPVSGVAAASMQQAQRRARVALHAGPADFSANVEREITALAESFTDPRTSVDHDQAARIAVALGDKALRDQLLVRLAGPDADALRLLLTAVGRLAQPPDDAPVCTLVGFANYIDGSGVVASAAFERALATDPGYVMAVYLHTLLCNQVPPEQVREIGAIS